MGNFNDENDLKQLVEKIVIDYFDRNNIDFIENTELTFEERLEETEKVLNNYKNIKFNLENIEKNYFTKEEIELAKIKEIKYLMNSNFNNNDTQFQEKYSEYIKTKRYFNFLNDTFNEYIKGAEDDGTLKYELKISYLKDIVMDGMKVKDFINKYVPNNANYYYRAKNEVIKEITPLLWGIDGTNLYKIFPENNMKSEVMVRNVL